MVSDTLDSCVHTLSHEYFTPSRCRVAVLLYTEIVPQWRVCISCSVPQHIAAPLLLYRPVPRASDPPQLPRGSSRGCDRARAFMYSPPDVLPVGVRSPWHPQNGRFASASSIREFQTVRSTAGDIGPSAIVIIPRTIYDARLDNG